jgi:hypothetical protein
MNNEFVGGRRMKLWEMLRQSHYPGTLLRRLRKTAEICKGRI